MPRTRSLAWAELKIGLMALVALVLAAVLTFLVGGQGGFFWQRYHLKTRFANVQGLKPGAVVRVAGVEVGKVASVEFSGAEVEVTLQVLLSMQPRITDRSRAAIGSLSLLGEPVVDIVPSAVGTPVPDWGYLPASRSPGQLADVAENASVGLQEATALLRDMRQGKGTVGRLFTDDKLYRDIDGFVLSAESVAAHLAEGRGTIGMLMKDPDVYRSLVASLTSLGEVSRRLGAGEGTLGRLLADDSLAEAFTGTGRNLEAITAKVREGEGTAGRLVNDRALYDRFNRIAERLEQVTARLATGEGTAGQLLHDEQLYENMNGAASELRALVGDIRKDPKKYLNVKVSIF